MGGESMRAKESKSIWTVKYWSEIARLLYLSLPLSLSVTKSARVGKKRKRRRRGGDIINVHCSMWQYSCLSCRWALYVEKDHNLLAFITCHVGVTHDWCRGGKYTKRTGREREREEQKYPAGWPMHLFYHAPVTLFSSLDTSCPEMCGQLNVWPYQFTDKLSFMNRNSHETCEMLPLASSHFLISMYCDIFNYENDW